MRDSDSTTIYRQNLPGRRRPLLCSHLSGRRWCRLRESVFSGNPVKLSLLFRQPVSGDMLLKCCCRRNRRLMFLYEVGAFFCQRETPCGHMPEAIPKHPANALLPGKKRRVDALTLRKAPRFGESHQLKLRRLLLSHSNVMSQFDLKLRN